MQHLLGELFAQADVVPRGAAGARGRRHLPVVHDVITWMYEHMNESITLGKLAQLRHVTPDYLIDAFKGSVGIPPLKFLQGFRLQRAKQLLLQTNLTVQEISAHIGWKDSLYFSRLFKKTEGVPPTLYRSMLRAY